MHGSDPTQALQSLRATFWFTAQGAENDYYDVIADLGRVDTYWVDSVDNDFYSAGPAFAYHGTVKKVGDATGVVDVQLAEIRVTVPLAVFHRGPGCARRGAALHTFG